MDKNASATDIKVWIDTDVGELYSVGIIATGDSSQVEITKRGKLLWVVSRLENGQLKKSKKSTPLHWVKYLRLLQVMQ